ncbi:GntR family transcriptional regulator [Actinoallomurus purpureus]|uniref:GntR family transcriptional regulator n=1 Tax=Actinoallomurus purpureus TaxID=478114 RepID=UPI002093FC3E|nr:GntR family transcriptional regulator [Actinoallomurus purpureus]MCO6009458.1 GntR family transcriptional regulator [Actinoallomurus purpureus]
MPLQARYEQIAADLRARISAGEFADGKLPSERELGEHYGASRNTIRGALGQLVNLGIIRSVKGLGYEVPSRTPLIYYATASEKAKRRSNAELDIWFTDVREQGRVPSQRLTVRHGSAPADITTLLNLDPDAEFAIRDRLRYVDDEPWAISTAYWPKVLFAGTPIMEERDLHPGPNRIAADLGYPQPRLHDRITARMPTADESRILGMDPGIPVHVHTRIGWTGLDDTAIPVRATVNILPADRWIIVYEERADD